MIVLRDNGALTRREAAEYLRISVRTLDKLAKERKVSCSKLGDGLRARVVYQRRELDAYLERMKVDPRGIARKILDAG
jgi:excisionase family DNA binding protein